jgi:hypothetical protein
MAYGPTYHQKSFRIHRRSPVRIRRRSPVEIHLRPPVGISRRPPEIHRHSSMRIRHFFLLLIRRHPHFGLRGALVGLGKMCKLDDHRYV